MRTFLVLVGVALLVVVGLMQVGFISFEQTRPGVVRAPAIRADVGTVDVGLSNRTIQVPTIEVEKPANTQAAQ